MRTGSSGDLIAGKYRLERPLARGGMGEVWTAKNLQLDVPVAIKLMSAQALSSPELVQRFEREAKAAAQLRHQNVVTIFEHGVVDGVPFMAMELLDGQDLSARIRQRGRLSHAEALPIVSGVCKALRRAHEMQIVHRDLKPANIFLVRQDDDEIVKVLDFGIAKILGDALGAESTKAGGLLGTPHYMAPEQAQTAGVRIDHRADLWALGVITFRLLTGALPFPGKDPVQVLVQICTEQAPLASSVARDMDAKVDSFFQRALARAPADRYQSARDFAEAFAALDGRGRVDPLAQSWATAPPSDADIAPPRPSAAPATPALRGIEGPPLRSQAPPPRASSPGMAGPPRSDKPFVEDPLDSAQTLPIQASARAQAFQPPAGRGQLLRTLPLSEAGPVGRGTVPMGLVSPLGVGGLPGGPAAPAPQTQHIVPSIAPSVPRGADWSSDSAAMPTLATTAEAGTITRATAEVHPASMGAAKRNTGIVIAAVSAAVLAIVVVSYAVISAATSDAAVEPPLPAAQTTAVPAPADTPSSATPGTGDTKTGSSFTSQTTSAGDLDEPAPAASTGVAANPTPTASIAVSEKPAAPTPGPSSGKVPVPVKPKVDTTPVSEKLKHPQF